MLIFEFRESRTSNSDPPQQVMIWKVTGENDPAVVRAAMVAGTPRFIATTQGILWRHNLQVEPEGYAIWRITNTYGKYSHEVGAVRFDFDTTGGTIHIVHSYQTRGKYPAGAPDFKNLIGVHGDQVDGTEVVIPALRINTTFRHGQGFITPGRMKLLGAVTGTVNSLPWRGFDAGEMLFLGATGGEGVDIETETHYGFAASANATGLSVGDIAGIAKKGHEYLWVKYQDEVDGGKPVRQPEFAYVEQVYEEVDFTAVLGF